MNNALFGIPNMDIYLVMGILLFFGLLEVIAGHWHRSKRTTGDWIQELGAFIVLGMFTKPTIVISSIFLLNWGIPSLQYALEGMSFWLLLPLFLFVDDFLQYWYHRFAHEYPFLWKLHRAHHQAEEMGFFVSYRNAALYYFFMPNIWWIGIFTFLGGAYAIAVGVVLKQIVIVSSHSTLTWDAALYKWRIFHPIMSVLERIIITPAFHHAHHGKSQIDGISDPNGNYGNMFSIWDQLFGTALFTRQFPKEYGLMNDPKEYWTAPYLYPFVKAKDATSELSTGFKKEKTSIPEPINVELEAGKNYLWCQCGKSKQQPFCDGSHQGSKFKPLLFTAKRSGKVRLCNCKTTKTGPFCDNSHLSLLTNK